MTTKDKKPVYKVGKAIKKSYIVYNSENKVILRDCDTLEEACKTVADEEYPSPVGIGEERYKIDRKRHELAKELEREFIRKEEKEKGNKPLDGNNFTTIVMIEYSDEQLKKYATENLESLVNGLFEDYTWYEFELIDFKPF